MMRSRGPRRRIRWREAIPGLLIMAGWMGLWFWMMNVWLQTH